MPDTLDRIRSLMAAGQWMTARATLPALLDSAPADVRVELHAALSVAYYRTADCPTDWQRALAHAHTCLREAPTGSYRHAWALHQLACLYADMGRARMVRMYANAFLRQAAGRPELDRFVPYVVLAQAQALYQQRRFPAAASIAQRALRLFATTGDAERVARVAQIMVWAYVRIGRVRDAREAFVTADSPANQPYAIASARAAIAWVEGNWADVLAHGREAIRGARPAQDNVDAAEVCLIMAEASRKLGAAGWQTLAYMDRAAQFAARQDCTIYSLIVLNQRAGGRCPSHACAAARGSADPRDIGCFATGVA